jgi:DNA (cytosine-5)-methyltransferase 1
MTLTVGSLFSGIGGLELGLERAGMEVKWQVEIDEFCNKVLAKHWPDVERHRDVREVGAHNLVPVDLICGGFPCQPFSLAGKRQGTEDPRHLWPEYRRIVDELRPTWVLGENVPGIRNAVLDDIILDLEGMGYTVGTLDIPAAFVGAPHLRHRFFIVAHANGTGQQERRGAVAMGAQQRPTECGGQETADADCGPCEQRDTREWGLPVIDEGGDGQRPRYWSAEPNVGRVIDGFRAGMDGGGLDEQVDGAKAGTASGEGDSLRSMRIDGSTTATPSELEQAAGSNGALPSMSRVAAHQRGDVGAGATRDGAMCDLRKDVSAVGLTPTQDVWGRVLGGVGTTECAETLASYWGPGWEDGVPRVSTGVKNRVDRLRALGNAVVPQVAEYIGRLIVAAHQEE